MGDPQDRGHPGRPGRITAVLHRLASSGEGAGCYPERGGRFGKIWDGQWLLLGPPSVLFPALEKFRTDIKVHCSLELEISKSECISWSEQLPVGAPPDIKLAGAVVEGKWETEWLVYGCPVGTDAYVAHMLDVKVE